MGVVYAAHDEKLDRRVAIKLVLGTVAGSAGSDKRKRLEREARALAKLSHPNVIQVFEIGEHAGQLYIVMEFVDGTTLGGHFAELEGLPDKWKVIVDAMLSAGAGLAAAHDAGLVHRDFKPDNVLVDRDGRVRVMDFGVAHAGQAPALDTLDIGDAPSTAAVGMTRTGALVGTPAYMSPEQISGTKVDGRSDQFAFCVVLYEALFGRRPFVADNVAALMGVILDGPEPDFSGAECPAEVVEVLRRGLARDPDARFADLPALLDALRQAAADPPAETKKSRPVWQWGLGALGVLGSVAALVVMRPSASEKPPAGTEPAPADAAEEPPQGELPKSVIQRVIGEHFNDVRDCYFESLKVNPGLTDELKVEFVIGIAGNVESARLLNNIDEDAGLGSCIASRVMTWRFPQPKGGPVTVTYPFYLSAG